MRVVALNGSPRKNSNTGQLIDIVAGELTKEKIETKVISLTDKNYHGCNSCGGCREAIDNLCVINDGLKEIQHEILKADGLIIGSPVYYAQISGQTKCALDRIFYSPAISTHLRQKPGASILSVRRGGALPAYNGIHAYFGISGMYIVGSTYWNFAIGRLEGECHNDDEGIKNMIDLGQNMAYLLKKLNVK